MNAHWGYRKDCLTCDYCILAQGSKRILCTGRTRIASLEDFKRPPDVCIKVAKEREERRKFDLIERRICPYCKGILRERRGHLGKFLGCSNFPNCTIMILTNSSTGEVIIRN